MKLGRIGCTILCTALLLGCLATESSFGWLVGPTFWDTGAVSLTDPVGDQAPDIFPVGPQGFEDISAIYYKVDFDADTAYFRMDIQDPAASLLTVSHQIGIDATGDSITTAEDPGAPSALADPFENIGVDRYLDARWDGGSFTSFYYTEDDGVTVTTTTLASQGGAFDYTVVELDAGDAGDEAVLEWSIPLALIDTKTIIDIYGATHREGAPGTFDSTASLQGSTAPEPSTFALMGVLCIVGFVMKRRMLCTVEPK